MGRIQLAAGATLGGMVVYFTDRRQGKRRRATAVDKLRSRARRARRSKERRQRTGEQRRRGEQLESMGAGRFRPADDIAVAAHLHQVLRQLDVSTADVTVEVHEGVVRVRGQVDRGKDQVAVLEAISAQPGVSQVENLLHLPDEVAPNKAAVLAATRSSA